MGLSILGINLMMILSSGCCLVLRPTPRAFPVWTSSLSSVSTPWSRSTAASGLCSMLASTLNTDPWPSSQLIVESVQVTLQACSGFLNLLVGNPQGCLIHRWRSWVHFISRSIFGISRGCLPLQPFLRWREDLLDCPSPFHFSTGGKPWCSV